MVLFQAFKYNPAALTSLCLLARQYRLAYQVILTFAHEF
jgi:Vacuolar protein 14 C-terminal Fig4p binding